MFFLDNSLRKPSELQASTFEKSIDRLSNRDPYCAFNKLNNRNAHHDQQTKTIGFVWDMPS